MSPVAWILLVVVAIVAYCAGRIQDALIDWLRDALGLAVSALVYLLVLVGVTAVCVVAYFALTGRL